MGETQEQENLYRYLDAKFDGIDVKIGKLQALWEAESDLCAKERAELMKRVGTLEKWAYLVRGAVAVIGASVAGIPGFFGKLIAAAGGK